MSDLGRQLQIAVTGHCVFLFTIWRYGSRLYPHWASYTKQIEHKQSTRFFFIRTTPVVEALRCTPTSWQ